MIYLYAFPVSPDFHLFHREKKNVESSQTANIWNTEDKTFDFINRVYLS